MNSERDNQNHPKRAGSIVLVITMAAAGIAQAQVPSDIEAGLRKIGQIVDPACTAKLYRPLMPKDDVNSNLTPLYPGITIARDVDGATRAIDEVPRLAAAFPSARV